MILTHNKLVCTEHQPTFERLPEAFSGVRLLQISDLHFYEYTDESFYQAVSQQIQALRPDVIVVTGDIIHYGHQHLDKARRFLSRLSAPLGCYAILGNHDYSDDAQGQHVTEMLAKTPIRLLNNAHVVLEKTTASGSAQKIILAGLDDLWKGKPCISTALKNRPEDASFIITLIHNPLLFDPVAYYEPAPIDFVLAGHTHAGHVHISFLRWIYRQIFKMKYRYGWHEKNGTQLYITSGVGSAAFYNKRKPFRFGLPRFRFNTHPEIALITLQKTPNAN